MFRATSRPSPDAAAPAPDVEIVDIYVVVDVDVYADVSVVVVDPRGGGRDGERGREASEPGPPTFTESTTTTT